MFIQHNSLGVILGAAQTSDAFDPADGTIVDVTPLSISITDIFDVFNGFFKKKYVGGAFVDDPNYQDKAENIESFRSLLNVAGASASYGVLNDIDMTQYYTKAEVNSLDFGAETLGELTDVDVSNVTDGAFLEYNGTSYSTTTELRPTALIINGVDVEKAEPVLVSQADYDPTPVPISDKLSLMRYIGGGELENMKFSQADEGRYGQVDYNTSSTIEWATGPWAGDVTSLTYNDEMVDLLPSIDESVPADVTAFEDAMISTEFVLHDAHTGKYWKLDFTDWTYWSENYMEEHYLANDGAILPVPSYSYTRTEYLDPAAGTLDPATAVTITVTDYTNSDTIDLIHLNVDDPKDSVCLYRGYSKSFGNPMNDDPEGQWNVYDNDLDATVWRSTTPYGCKVAVVNNYSDILDPNMKWSTSLDDAFGGGIGNKIVGSKVVYHEEEADIYHGLEFVSWTSGGNGSGWSANYVELDGTKKTGITFADGTVQTTLGGDVSYDREEFDNTFAGYTGVAPLAFFKNPGLINTATTDNVVSSEAPIPDEISCANGFQLEYAVNEYGNPYARLVAYRFRALSSNIDNLDVGSALYSSYTGAYTVSWNSFASSIDRRPVARFNIASFGTATQAIVAEPQDGMTSSVHGTYDTKIIISNQRTGATGTIVFQNNHCDLNGFTLPSVATGEEWMIKVETMQLNQRDVNNNPIVKRRVVDVYQLV